MRVGHIAQKAARLPLAHSVRANRIGRLLCRHRTRCVDAGSAMRVRVPPECFKNGILQGACSDLNY